MMTVFPAASAGASRSARSARRVRPRGSSPRAARSRPVASPKNDTSVGTPRAIYERAANRFVAGFVGDNTVLDGGVTASSGTTCTVALPRTE